MHFIFKKELTDVMCASFDILGFRHIQTMAFAVHEINRNPHVLPNVTRGYVVYDSCATLGISLWTSLSLASGQEDQFLLDETCVVAPPVIGIVSDSYL